MSQVSFAAFLRPAFSRNRISFLVSVVACFAACFGVLGVSRSASAASFGTNLLVNGDAESGIGSATGNDLEPIPGWSASGNITVVQYGAPGLLSLADPGPTNPGKNFFAGGPDIVSSQTPQGPIAIQNVDVSSLATQIDAGTVHYDISGWFGGVGSSDDNMFLGVAFRQTDFTELGGSIAGGIDASGRSDQTGLFLQDSTGKLPAGTRILQVALEARVFDPMNNVDYDGKYDTGFADNLSIVLTNQTSGGGTSGGAVPLPAAAWQSLALLAILAVARVYRGARRSAILGSK
ncbi:MAG: hypothetical protein ABSB74_02735 [Tepidisphaeraceae bacterium]